jgi:hypothetical protein
MNFAERILSSTAIRASTDVRSVARAIKDAFGTQFSSSSPDYAASIYLSRVPGKTFDAKLSALGDCLKKMNISFDKKSNGGGAYFVGEGIQVFVSRPEGTIVVSPAQG